MWDVVFNLSIFYGLALTISSLWCYLFSYDPVIKKKYLDRAKVAMFIALALILYRFF